MGSPPHNPGSRVSLGRLPSHTPCQPAGSVKERVQRAFSRGKCRGLGPSGPVPVPVPVPGSVDRNGELEGERQAERIDNEVNFRGKAAPRTTYSLRRGPPFTARRMAIALG